MMGSLRMPESCPLTFRSEISQGIARRRVGNLCFDDKEKSARQAANGHASSDDHAAHRFYLKQQQSARFNVRCFGVGRVDRLLRET
jgi:hypothetical protein